MGSTVKKTWSGIKKTVKSTANIVKNTAKGDFDEALKSTGRAVDVGFRTATGIEATKGSIQDTTKFLADATGATAAQEQLDQQAAMARREARRQALLSDAMARNAGGDSARIITGRRGSSNSRGGQSTSSKSGTQTSARTGVQS